jgi:hypothetical protein
LETKATKHPRSFDGEMGVAENHCPIVHQFSDELSTYNPTSGWWLTSPSEK